MRNWLTPLAIAVMFPSVARPTEPPAGSWRMPIDLGGGRAIVFLITFEKSEQGWTGKFLGATDFTSASVQDVKVSGVRLTFGVKLDEQVLGFDGKLAGAGQRISGSLSIGDDLLLTALEPSQLAKFDRSALLKEIVDQGALGYTFFDATVELLKNATADNAPADDVRRWLDKAAKASEGFGVRWQLITAVRMVRALLDQPDYYSAALPIIRSAEKLLAPTDEPATQLPMLETLSELLTRMRLSDEAKALAPRIEKLEETDERKYAAEAPFQPQPFPGRKAGSTRGVLVELFTGAECPPCIAADLAFDALGKAYRPSDVIRLQYHLHIPAPDPITNPIAEARQQYYKVEGTPTIFFNGKPAAGGGGAAFAAVRKFQEYQKVVDADLEQPSQAQLTLKANRTDDVVSAHVAVTNLAKPGPNVKLRVFLVEEFVRYRGGNGIRFHYSVVRGVIGPAEGTVLAAANSTHSWSANLAEIRQGLAAYLDRFTKDHPEVSFFEKPLKLSRLRVVAFVQNDDTRDVHQAVQAEVK
jgi:hypothetical protein